MSNLQTSLRAAPAYTTGAALLLWGWQTGFLIYAVPMAILVEVPRWIAWRWPISHREFNIVADLSGVGFFIVVVYIFMETGAKGIFVILSVMPFILFLLLVLQLYSSGGKIRMSSLFVSLRRMPAATTAEADREIDISLPYLLLCIVSASSGNLRTIWFFILTCVLIAIVLWSVRPKRYPATVWATLVVLAFSLGYAGQMGIREVQRSIEMSILGIFDQFMWRYRDPDRATTAMGSIGRLKLSDRIVLRAKSQTPLTGPLLLREASYRKYNYGIWSNPDSVYTVVDPEIDVTTWMLSDGKHENTISISTYMTGETGVIPIPHDTSSIHGVAATEINRNQYGAVRMEIREGWINYQADYQTRLLTDAPPEQEDLLINENYQQDFQRLVSELGLNDIPPERAVARVESFFAENFSYSLIQHNRYPKGKYLHNFLFDSRTGHCEYFATSTVLLLRAAGIPARYAAGYVIDEYSTLEGQYIARSRDAHSWAIAYVGDAWRVVDTTPAIWAPMEDENASAFVSIIDLFSWIRYRISIFQSRDELEEETSNSYLLYLLIPLVLVLVWRLYFKERTDRHFALNTEAEYLYRQGLDSDFYRLTRTLENAGYVRRKGETLAEWLRRIDKTADDRDIHKALRLHYRYRFDPLSSAHDIKNELSFIVNSILASGTLAGTGRDP